MLSNDKKKAEAWDTIMKSICLNHKYDKIGISKIIQKVFLLLIVHCTSYEIENSFFCNAKRCIKGVIKHTSSSKMLFTA